jgi:hypothetical protein
MNIFHATKHGKIRFFFSLHPEKCTLAFSVTGTTPALCVSPRASRDAAPPSRTSFAAAS